MWERLGVRVACVCAALAVVVVLAGCSRDSSRGTLTGHVYMVGGPVVRGPGPAARPLAGRVVATGGAGSYTADVGSDGAYTLQVPPGRYEVSATSPSYNDGLSPCRVAGTVIVAANTERTVDIYCQVR